MTLSGNIRVSVLIKRDFPSISGALAPSSGISMRSARAVIVEMPGMLSRMARRAASRRSRVMNVEKVFRNIHADGRRCHLFRAFACHPGCAPWYPFRPKEKTGVMIL